MRLLHIGDSNVGKSSLLLRYCVCISLSPDLSPDLLLDLYTRSIVRSSPNQPDIYRRKEELLLIYLVTKSIARFVARSAPVLVVRISWKIAVLSTLEIWSSNINMVLIRTNLPCFKENTFSEALQVTLGFDFKYKKAIVDGFVVMLQLWDSGGIERFRSVRGSYFRGCWVC